MEEVMEMKKQQKFTVWSLATDAPYRLEDVLGIKSEIENSCLERVFRNQLDDSCTQNHSNAQ